MQLGRVDAPPEMAHDHTVQVRHLRLLLWSSGNRSHQLHAAVTSSTNAHRCRYQTLLSLLTITIVIFHHSPSQ